MKAWLQGELEPDGIAPERLGRWALWAGNTEARRLGLSLQDSSGWTAARDRHGLGVLQPHLLLELLRPVRSDRIRMRLRRRIGRGG